MRPLGPGPTVTSRGRGHDRSHCQGLGEGRFSGVFDGGARHRDAGAAAGVPTDILLVDGKIVTWAATSSISDALAGATGRGEEIRKLAGPANGAS